MLDILRGHYPQSVVSSENEGRRSGADKRACSWEQDTAFIDALGKSFSGGLELKVSISFETKLP